MGVEIPAVGGVDFGLQFAHFLHEGVEIGIRIGHFFANLVEPFDFLGDRTESELDVFAYGFVFVQRRILLEDSDRVAGGEGRLAVRNGVEAGHDAQQRGLAHAVGAHHADFRAGQEAQGHVVEDDSIAVGLARLDHLIDEFSQSCSVLLMCAGEAHMECNRSQ